MSGDKNDPTQGCTCNAMSKKTERCNRDWIRCNGRLTWKRKYDEKYRKVWGITDKHLTEKELAEKGEGLMSKRAMPQAKECDLCDRPLTQGDVQQRGECAYTGSRGCKVAQGRDQVARIRRAAKREGK